MEKDIFQEYGYNNGQEILIPAEFLMGVMYFCNLVDSYQPKVVTPMVYPKSVTENKDKDGNLIDVEIDWVDFPTADSFAKSSFKEGADIKALTDVGQLSFQIRNALYNYHQNNIENGVAKKAGGTV